MFSYYGSKSKVIDSYPVPQYGRIVEPFAGSARYALRFFDRDVLLVDCRPAVIDTWHYLQLASKNDVLALPEPKPGQSFDDFGLSKGERYLLGWLAGRGATHPRNTVQKFSCISRDKASIANQLHKIKHWDIRLGDYKDIPNQRATWFIDPPYQFGGGSYRTAKLNYTALAEWCRERKGHVIVCENTKADWMPFFPLRKNRGAQGTTIEAIWSNEYQQLSLV